jgi:hypothetical protein
MRNRVIEPCAEGSDTTPGTPLEGTVLVPPSRLKDPAQEYAEELCWRAAVGEVLNSYAFVRKTPGDVGEAVRLALTARLKNLLTARTAFCIAQDNDIRQFINARVKEIGATRNHEQNHASFKSASID